MNELETDAYLIWWLSQQACEQIGEPIDDIDYQKAEQLGDDLTGIIKLDSLPWPEYIRIQFSDRWGRSGRGCLWTSNEFPQSLEVPKALFEKDRPLIRAIAEDCGGIVIRKEDGLLMAPWPGFITDFSLQIWNPQTEEK